MLILCPLSCLCLLGKLGEGRWLWCRLDSEAGWTLGPQTSPPGPALFREGCLSLVAAESPGQHCALPGTQPRGAGGWWNPIKATGLGQAPELAPTSNSSPKWPTGWALSRGVRPGDGLATGARPERGTEKLGRRRGRGPRAMPGEARGFPNFTLGGLRAACEKSVLSQSFSPSHKHPEQHGGPLHRGVPGLSIPSEGNWLTKNEAGWVSRMSACPQEPHTSLLSPLPCLGLWLLLSLIHPWGVDQTLAEAGIPLKSCCHMFPGHTSLFSRSPSSRHSEGKWQGPAPCSLPCLAAWSRDDPLGSFQS